MDSNSELRGEVVEHPHVVVSGKERNRYSLIAKFGELALQADKSAWYRVFVFEPEVKDIAQKINRIGFVFDRIEPGNDLPFTPETFFRGGYAQVKIGGEKDLFVVKRGDFFDHMLIKKAQACYHT